MVLHVTNFSSMRRIRDLVKEVFNAQTKTGKDRNCGAGAAREAIVDEEPAADKDVPRDGPLRQS